ncbi:MAG: Gfo/Idh/MocA family oxidoreductase [Kiritimatiellae bacterium]|nr:Gfo/Idh/MocA family oxidoreductase [Kiritimatiellia bacterium]
MSGTRDKTRVVVVGIGGRGTWAAQSVARSEHFELVALCEKVPGKLERKKADMGLPDVPGYPSVEECLAKEDFQAVVVTAGDCDHAGIAVPALAAGKYVFLEKPLEVTAEKCRAIVEADRKAGGKTFVGFNLRFAPVYVRARELIEQGEIGRILTLQTDEFYNGGRTYFRRWNRLRRFGGGLWITKACHDFDILYWMAGCRPVSVYATAALSYYTPRADAPLHCSDCDKRDSCYDSHFVITANKAKRKARPASDLPEQPPLEGKPLCLYNSDKDTFDHGIATIEFENGILATYTCNVVAGFSDRRIRVSGTKGTIDGNLHDNSLVLNRRDPSAREEVPLVSDGSGHGGADRSILDAFYEFTQGRREPKVRPEQAMIPVLIGLAATRAGDEKRRVEMAEFGL